MTAPKTAESETAAPRPNPLQRPVVAALLLLLVYGALSLVMAPEGYLGTDTGGKVLTLQAIEERGSLGGLDVGYWAEKSDPDGELHGYFGTSRTTDGWVQVTTVPMILAARPLFDAGGYRLALLVPMLGGLAAALAARALCRRFGGSNGSAWLAYWIVGLAGPVLLYALDLWEHTLGLAAMAWAAVLTIDASRRLPERLGPGVAAAAGAGVLWGLGFSMRTESLLYGAVVTAAYVLAAWKQRRFGAGLILGAATAVGLGVAIAANNVLESAVLGETFRSGRASGTVDGFGSQLGTRIEEGFITTVGLNGSRQGIVLGLLTVVALAILAKRAGVPGRLGDRSAVLIAVVAVLPVLLVAISDLGFIPGLLVTSPIAVVGLVYGRSVNEPVLVLAVVAALPLVWLFQYIGGAAPQWGGRYVLVTSLVLTVAGISQFRALDARFVRGVISAAVLVTGIGVAWMIQRTHAFADAGRQLATIDEPVLIARNTTGFMPREFVARNGERRWLATEGEDEFERAVAIVADTDAEHFGVLVLAGESVPDRVGGFEKSKTTTVPLLPGVDLEVVDFVR